MVRLSFVSMISAAALSFSAAAHSADAPPVHRGDPVRGAQLAASVCAACHGADGNSPSSANPKLAGQHAAYLFKQMKDYKAGPDGKPARVNPIMNGLIAAFTDEQMRDMAAFYAEQKPTIVGVANRDHIPLGQRIWRAGDASKGLPACASCHGPAGAGIPAQYPRLNGQFAEYTAAQLKAFRSGERSNDLNRMMRMTAERMTDAEIRAVSDYIAGLH